MGRGGGEQLSWLRRIRVAAALAGVGCQRNPQYPRSLRAEMGAWADAGEPRSTSCQILAPDGGSQETRLPRPLCIQRRSEFRQGSARPPAFEVVRGIAV